MRQLSRTGVVVHRMQDEVVRVYRDSMGYPRLEQQRERGSTAIVVLAVAAMAAVYASVWFVS